MLAVVPIAEPQPWLRKQQMIREDKPAVAATLLFSDEPQAILPKRSAIKIYRYRTNAPQGSRETLAIAAAVARADAHGLELVRFLYADHGGVIRGKACTRQFLAERIDSGIGHSVAMMAMSMLDTLPAVDGKARVHPRQADRRPRDRPGPAGAAGRQPGLLGHRLPHRARLRHRPGGRAACPGHAGRALLPGAGARNGSAPGPRRRHPGA